jgi:ABC-2 type transport system permease protein
MKAINKIFASKFWWVLLLVILFAVNYLAAFVYARFDLTKEKRYTLSKATKGLVKNLKEEVQIDVFLKGEFPSGFRKLANTTKEFLGLLKEINGSKIQYRFIDPTDLMPNGKPWADTLESLGAKSINLTVQKKAGTSSNYVYPVALVKDKDKQNLINLLAGANRVLSQDEINTAEALLEYQFLNSIVKLTKNTRQGVGYAVGNGEPIDQRTYGIRTTLQDEYDFRVVDLVSQPKVPDSVRLLVIVKPTEQFSEVQKLKIDQFVMRGGKLLCFIDNLYAEMDSLKYKPETVAYDRNLNLTDLFFRYGLRINTDLVMDLRCDVTRMQVGGTPESPQIEFLPWNYYPFVTSPESAGKFITPGYIGMRFVNSIDTINVKGVKKTPLLVSSKNSRIISTPALISLNENRVLPEDEKFKQNAIPVAMLAEGSFTSLFKNRMGLSQLDSLNSTGQPFKEVSENNSLIVVADGDMPLTEFIPQFSQDGQPDPNLPPMPLDMGWNKFSYYEYLQQSELAKYFTPVSNKDFFLNCVEYLLSDPAISETRNKDIVLRLLDSKKVGAQKSTWQFINIAVPVLLVILCGWIYQQVRKRKYAA